MLVLSVRELSMTMPAPVMGRMALTLPFFTRSVWSVSFRVARTARAFCTRAWSPAGAFQMPRC